jgi:hypothetical protein
MSTFYGILAVMGWTFTCIVAAAFGFWWLWRGTARRKGFDVELSGSDEKQS